MDASLLLGLLALGLIGAAMGGYGRCRSRRSTAARLTPDGVQIVEVLVRAGYHPADVRVRAGLPVRLILRRDESDPCSSGIYLTEPPLRRHLPAFATTEIVFTPEKPGNHLFTCEEGRHRGHLIVEPPGRSLPSDVHRRTHASGSDNRSLAGCVSRSLPSDAQPSAARKRARERPRAPAAIAFGALLVSSQPGFTAASARRRTLSTNRQIVPVRRGVL